jgi:hypothetical protein
MTNEAKNSKPKETKRTIRKSDLIRIGMNRWVTANPIEKQGGES